MFIHKEESVLDKPLTITYHTLAFATGLTKVADKSFTATGQK
jgi:hypothetical protein